MSELSDSYLLELAARAIGIDGFVAEDWTGPHFVVPGNPDVPRSYPVIYRWLTDDGDALRLAARLRISVSYWAVLDAVTAMRGYGGSEESCGDDPYAATRRAIVRAAAEIGKEIRARGEKKV
jgi:hypothetical protein